MLTARQTDDTMLGTLSLPISTTYNALPALSWIQTVFPIGSSIAQPLSGHLTDIYGRRAGFLLSAAFFASGTLICGLAPSLWLFLLGRLLEGMGGGAMVSICSFVETDMVPLSKRGLIEGLGNVGYGIMLALGGVYGGGIDGAIGWKWAFLIQPPLIVLDAVLIYFVIKIPQVKSSTSGLHRIDWAGICTLVVAIVLFQLAMNAGGNLAPWDGPLPVTSFVVAATSFCVFVYWDSFRALNPVLPLRSMFQRTVAASQLSFFLASAANAGILFYVPIHLQILGLSTGQSGLRFIPMAAAVALSSFVTGYVVKVTCRYYWPNFVVQICAVLGTALLCTMTRQTPAWCIFVYLAITGAGTGGAFVTRLMGVLSSADEEKQAVIQAASWTIESAGLTFGITVASAIFQKISIRDLDHLLANKPQLLIELTTSYSNLSHLQGPEKVAIMEVYLKATRAVFILAAAEMALAALISLAMKNNELKDDEDSPDNGDSSENGLPEASGVVSRADKK